MRDLRTDPLWQKEDLGAPVPDVRHACSMCLPTWQSVIDYEEGRDKVLRKLETGYPRFIFSPDVASLFSKLRGEYAQKGQRVMVFPTRGSAQRAQRFMELRQTVALEIKSYKGVFVLVYPENSEAHAKLFWRYSGEGVSSRQAQRILENLKEKDKSSHARDEMASFFNIDKENLHLWASGMAAIFATHRHINKQRKGKKTLQVDVPYVDAMRLQRSFGAGVVFLAESKGEDLRIALERIKDREFAAVYAEIPSNPLLKTPAIEEISKACRTSQTPFILDDTVASHYNVDVLEHADVVTTSLTKWVSGKGDVMAGATRINPKSAFAEEFRLFFDDQGQFGSTMDWEDEEVLLSNKEDFQKRMEIVNKSGESIADFLNKHDLVEEVFYPKFNTIENYNSYKTPQGGYGGLISIILKNEKKAPAFYDALRLTKGPSLGTEFSLACPYTLLAHYDELDWAETNKMSQNLIRISIGTEPEDHIMAILIEAFDAIR